MRSLNEKSGRFLLSLLVDVIGARDRGIIFQRRLMDDCTGSRQAGLSLPLTKLIYGRIIGYYIATAIPSR